MSAGLIVALAAIGFLLLGPDGSAWRRLNQGIHRAEGPTVREEGRRNPWGSSRRRGALRRQQEAADFMRVVRELSALLEAGRSGAALWEALGENRTVQSHAAVLGLAAQAARLGASVGTAIQQASRSSAQGAEDRNSRTRWHELAACLDVAEVSGAPLAGVLLRFAISLELEADAAAQRETALAGPRSTVRILSWLPVAGLLLGILMGADPIGMLLSGPVGWGVAAAGSVLIAAGHGWSALLVRRAETVPG